MPTDDTEKACGVHALDPLIHDDCPYCTQIRLAAKDEEISRLTTAWHAEMATEAAMRAEVERLRGAMAYEIEQLHEQLATAQAEIERLRGELDECRRLLREAVNRLESDPVWWVHSLACEYWCEQAAKAAGGGGSECGL
jgi:DNA repair exonuclease SbcCD ATPase subunit